MRTGTLELAQELNSVTCVYFECELKMYLQMLQKQVEFSLPLILEKLRIDLRDSQKDLTDIGGPLPTTEKDQV